jgi:hypothetical protein
MVPVWLTTSNPPRRYNRTAVDIDLHKRLWLFFAHDFWELWHNTNSMASLLEDVAAILGNSEKEDCSWQSLCKSPDMQEVGTHERTKCSPIVSPTNSPTVNTTFFVPNTQMQMNHYSIVEMILWC